MTSYRDQQREGQKKLDRRDEPHPIPDVSAVFPEHQCQRARNGRDNRGLPEMIRQCGKPFRAVHSGFPFFGRLRKIFSACFTSSSWNFPVSIKCAITGWMPPPKKLNNSSISRFPAAPRDTNGSKTCALLILLTRCSAFLSSN